jgi:lipopolysaccharide/colanic/teichoic acid biosynthesis glycosyltransferase
LLADLFSAELVWLLFLGFRWLVYEGKILSMETVVIPAFNFYMPLVIYPLVCLVVYYLSGYYLRPLQKPILRELWRTSASAAIISTVFFFAIVIDDQVDDYHRYFVSLAVLFGLQFVVSYIPRLSITLLSRRRGKKRVQTIHSLDEARALQAETVDEVIIDLPREAKEEEIYDYIKLLYPKSVEIAVRPRLYDILTGAARIDEVGAPPLVRITEHKMSDAGLCIKRAVDIVAALLTLVLLSPLYALLALLVALSSRGPILYRQERIGKHGLPFRILKFRTMFVDAEGETPQLSADHDPRITPVGRWMRRYRLDELPQMWNILQGDMSLVGPRPERAYFIRQIEERAPYYCLLYKVRPGLTSWGPIRVGYTDTMDKMVERLNCDIAYVENMSLALDVKILFFTVGVLVRGQGQ